MATISTINVSVANDGNGDTLRNAFVKTNDNFAELNSKKVEVELGKGLSENDFTDADKTKLDNSLTNNEIANNLTTIVTGKVLDATMGKELNDKIDAINGSVFNKFFEVRDLMHNLAYSKVSASINGGSNETNGGDISGNIFSTIQYNATAAARGFWHVFNGGNKNSKNGQTSYFCFKKGTSTAGVTAVMGNFSSTVLPTMPTNGAWFNLVDDSLTFVVGNGTTTSSSAPITITTGITTSDDFYHCFFYRISGIYHFRVYDNAFTQVMSGSLNTNLPLTNANTNQQFQVYTTNLPSPTNGFFFLAKFGYGFGIPNQLKEIFDI